MRAALRMARACRVRFWRGFILDSSGFNKGREHKTGHQLVAGTVTIHTGTLVVVRE